MSVRSVAKLVGLETEPISGQRVSDFTSQPLVIGSGPMHALTVQGFASLALHPSGAYVFVGHAHEDGIVGNNYAMSCVIDVRDDQGRALALEPHAKKLSGTVDPTGDRTDNFQIFGFDQRIRDRWGEIAGAKKQFTLHAATDPLQVVELVTEALVAAAAATGLVFLAIKAAPFIPIPEINIHVASDGSFEFVLIWTFPLA
jgi:hypothetical protein